MSNYGGQQILKDLDSIPLGVDCHGFLGRTLANTQIRVISRAIDYLRLVRDADPLVASNDELPGEPLPADYLGTRGVRRYKLRPGTEVRVDGNPTPLVDLSGTGAQLLGSTVLRVQQHIRLLFGFPPEVVRCSGLVAWVSFEPQGKSAPCDRRANYRRQVQRVTGFEPGTDSHAWQPPGLPVAHRLDRFLLRSASPVGIISEQSLIIP